MALLLNRLFASKSTRGKTLLVIALGTLITTGASANLLSDGSFEDPNFFGSWQFVNGGGNNTSVWNDNNDGLGFFNSAFGDFTNVNAEDGHHWIAAYSGDSGAWGQLLATPLVAGEQYSLDGWVHQSVRADLDNSGGWDIELNSSASLIGAVTVGHLGDTNTDQAWQGYTSNFVAPADAASRSFIIFVATGTPAGLPGLDNLDLHGSSRVLTPEPITMSLGIAGIGLFIRRRKKVG